MKIRISLLIFILVGNIFGQNQDDYRKELFNRIHEYNLGAIKKASSKIKIPDLSKAKFKENEAELRVWIIIEMFGVYWVECFSLRKENEQMKASYIVGLKQPPKKFKFKKFSLDEPKNGWQSLNKYLKTNGIDFDLNLTPESETIGGVHVETIQIEAMSGDKYKMYWYPVTTKNTDGKKVQLLCSKLIEEFDLNLEKFSFDGSKYKRLKCDN